jgi:DNA invertase Pin-like site-specific DNA recombinase
MPAIHLRASEKPASTIRNCEQYAARQGWTIVERYRDQARSGTMDERQRPAFKKLIDAARAKRSEILPIDDLSRLSRDSARNGKAAAAVRSTRAFGVVRHRGLRKFGQCDKW